MNKAKNIIDMMLEVNVPMDQRTPKHYGFKDYTKNSDGSYDVTGSVTIELPFKVRKVKGNYHCRMLDLTTLEGGPTEVTGSFDCSLNKLKNLKGAPKKVGNYFICGNNPLVSLQGCPKDIPGEFDCMNSNLKSLKGGPKTAGSFDCRDAAISFTEEDVRAVTKVKGRIRTGMVRKVWNN
jgi:hypothetical protein